MLGLAQATFAHEFLVETFGELTEGGGGAAQLPVLFLQPRNLRLALFQQLNTVVVAHTSFSPRVVRQNCDQGRARRTILKPRDPF